MILCKPTRLTDTNIFNYSLPGERVLSCSSLSSTPTANPHTCTHYYVTKKPTNAINRKNTVVIAAELFDDFSRM